MAKRIITHDQLKPEKGINLSKLQCWRLEKRGEFPNRVYVTPGRYGWIESEIDAYIESRIALRDAKIAKAV
jgi:prophage regulatory protein